MIILIIIFLIGIIFLYSCMKVSSICSEEERRDAYKYIRKKNKRKKKREELNTKDIIKDD